MAESGGLFELKCRNEGNFAMAKLIFFQLEIVPHKNNEKSGNLGQRADC